MNNERTNAEKFLIIYNDIDRFMRHKLNADIGVGHTYLIRRMAERDRTFAKYRDDLISCAELRNAIVHNPDNEYADPIAEPHDYIVHKYGYIRDSVMNPPRALDAIATKAEYVYTASMDSSALDVMKVMDKNTYTHVPIVENGIMVGVFSESTVFSYLVRNEDVVFEKGTRISKFASLIPCDSHESEFFSFVPKDTLVIDVQDMFKNGLKDGKRLSVVFITETGKQDERILGLITAWDVAGYKE